jgi:type VI secretion system protein ImpL
MFAFLKRFARLLLRILGLVLVALFIWYAGPYFSFAGYAPLESELTRLVLIAVIIAFWLGMIMARRVRAHRASDQLAAAVLAQPAPEKAQVSPEAAKLRERFEEAVAILKQQRKSGRNLYDLPWYVIIGAPGSGKTTALVNSGLRFPLESRVGRGALKGVGGTRNCDWWFTDDAIFLDTAGRYTTQDSDAESDAAGWAEFLALLRKYRKRRPVNGVILTISASDLITQGEAGREAHVEAARRRLMELNRELRIQLPIYLMVTKCDLVAGFSEYFDDLTHDGRAQVWGVTFPYEQTVKGEAAEVFPAEFDALMTRLNERLFGRIEEDRDVRRRAQMFAFPQQMAALKDGLTGFVHDVFAATRYDQQQILLRGVYFTSGTQEGTPIDRLLGAIGRHFGMAPHVVPATPGRGKAYFIQRLLTEVMLGESGLAGLNTRFEMQKAAIQLGAYAAAAIIAILAVIAFSISYGNNRDYLNQVAADVATLRDVPPVDANTPEQQLLPRLNAVRAVFESTTRYEGDVPWRMRWGLFQGRSVGNSARDAYLRELDSSLLPQVAARFRQRLAAYRGEPEKLYEYLKAYLMLGEPKRIDKAHLSYVADVEFGHPNPREESPSLATHFNSLLEQSDTLRPVPLDAAIIAQARSTIRQASVPRLVYGRLQRKYADDTARVVRLDLAAGVAGEEVIRRRSGAKLTDPVPSLYGRAVFKEITGVSSADLVKQFATDDWVWGEAGTFANNPVRMASEVMEIYERDYINTWNGILADLELVPVSTLAQTNKSLEVLSGPASPLRGLVAIVVDNTRLVATPGAAKPTTTLGAAGQTISEGVGKILKPLKEATGASTVEPGTIVTAQFQPIHRLVEGEPGNTPLDRIIAQLAQIHLQLQAIGPGIGNVDPSTALSNPALRESLQGLRQESTVLPPIMRSLVTEVGKTAETSVMSNVASGLERQFRQEVLAECARIVNGRYPFVQSSEINVPLADFGRLFGYGGVFDTFFQANLSKLVDTGQQPWQWLPGTVGVSNAMLRKFEEASRIRQMFFVPGSSTAGMRFNAMLGKFDPSAQNFAIDFEGQVLSANLQQRLFTITWPGRDGAQLVKVEFAQRFGDRPSVAYHGPWALWRMFDASTIQRESDVRNLVTVRAGNLQGQVIIEATSIRNPFASPDWQRFTCEP